MRLGLICAGAMILLLAAMAGLWVLRKPRPDPVLQPHAGGDVEPPAAAAELVPSTQLEQTPPAERVPVMVEEPSSRAEEGPGDGEPSAEVLVRVVSADDGTPQAGVQLLALLDGVGNIHAGGPVEEGDAGGLNAAPLTDEQGQARFHFPGGGGYSIFFPGQADRVLRLQLQPGEKRDAALWLRTSADVDLGLLVLDEQTRAPLEGALVEVRGLDRAGVSVTGATEKALSDALGLAALRLPSWLDLAARVSREGYGSVRLDRTWEHVDPTRPLEVRLPRCARLEGRVTDESGVPMGDVLVLFGGPEVITDAGGGVPPDIGVRWWRATTEPDGSYALDGLFPGVDLNVELHKGGLRAVRETRKLRLEPGEVRVHDLRFVLPSGW